MEDFALLRAYAAQDSGSDGAFQQLVVRYTDLVYSAALRQVRNPHLAEEVAQAVFIVLARKASSLNREVILAAWLLRVTRYIAVDLLKSESRRRLRESKAAEMNSTLESTQSPTLAWEQIKTVFDEALLSLPETDRQAIVLRYLDQRSLDYVGNVLGVSSEAAKKRVARGLDKLRKFFTRRCIEVTPGALTAALSTHAVQAAPAGLSVALNPASCITGSSTTLSASNLTLASECIKVMAWTKLKTSMVAGTSLLLVGGGLMLAFRDSPGGALSAPPAAARVPIATPAVQEAQTAALFDWQTVESPDYRQYIANLHSIGCPEETIRDIVTADVNKHFEARFKALKPQTGYQYWLCGKKQFEELMLDEETVKARQELAEERRAVLKHLLGVEPDGNPLEAFIKDVTSRLFAFLPPEKQHQVVQINHRFAARAEQGIDATDAEREMLAEIASVLTAEEMLEFELRFSSIANQMRRELGLFDPDEKEFRGIFLARKARDEALAAVAEGDWENRGELEGAFQDELRDVLGLRRAWEYHRSMNPDYRAVLPVLESAGLGSDSGDSVYRLQQDASHRHSRLLNDPGLPMEERRTRALELKSSFRQKLQEIVGLKVYEEILANPNASRWLRDLAWVPESTSNPQSVD